MLRTPVGSFPDLLPGGLPRARSLARFAAAFTATCIALGSPAWAGQESAKSQDTSTALPADQDARKAAVLAQIEPLLEQHGVPGVSLAVFLQGEIVWAEGLGVASWDDEGAGVPVSPQTLFQAASISKPVAACAALSMVASRDLELDADVNEFLLSWQVPDHEFSEAVTLRRLLCHGAGLTVHGFPGYDSGQDPANLLDVLDGSPPANTQAIFVDLKPGTRSRYSGGGYCVMQQMMVDILDQDFPSIMQQRVLQPLGMSHSTYAQPLPEALHGTAAHGHRGPRRQTPGDWHVYPEMAAAGLWTTPSDLCRFALGLCAAEQGKEGAVLPQSLIRQMLSPQIEDSMGLGLFLRNGGQTFEHGGANDGFRCRMACDRASRSGVVLMTNADNGSELFRPAIDALIEAYDWPETLMR